MRKQTVTGVFIAAILLLAASLAQAADFRIAIMQDQPGEAKKFRPLVEYLGGKGVAVAFVTARDYPAAAHMFAEGQVDAMFSGSGVAGSMLIKGVATPIVRPLATDGTSTYWASVIAPKGAKKFAPSADYFKGKQVIYCSLASSGEFFFHSIDGAPKAAAKMMTAPSHGAAIDALSKGQADIAIVKNWVWDELRSQYPNLAQVGEDVGENPNNSLIVSKKAAPATVSKVKQALLGVAADGSAEASAVRDSLKIKGFIETTEADFSHTISLLKKAGVTPSFNFSF